jgi:hypothetical protein
MNVDFFCNKTGSNVADATVYVIIALYGSSQT